jgi:hypothetical protein
MVAHTCHSNYMKSLNRRITVQSSLGKKQNPLSKITKAKGLGAWIR